ncbi:uncharacterized protein LOC8261919 [Ricinus communis]|uniref:Transferase, transferring glycosyl groups, putative n=1 Tax=Ricinus communis TaxID=3988 RepID=B9RDW1_RICCO|nr:uncharacterized protein LOC8261919 [Ricinus communis]EEF50569.1 transferase, transferring glycosyl groups, putative [Ricinus communis]|eukprot:XP_025015819.1 uncharacterized protein LOC8261919 [Ricinus communis]
MKDQENLLWDHNNMKHNPFSFTIPKLMFCFLIIISVPYIFYSLNSLFSFNLLKHQSLNIYRYDPHNQIIELEQEQGHNSYPQKPNRTFAADEASHPNPKTQVVNTSIHHVVFGIAASSELWDHRKEYVKLWWRPDEMRGIVWLDNPVKEEPSDYDLLPPIMISTDASEFPYNNTEGKRSAIRISRIISEILKLGMKDVRWFVMGDDDTVFIADNLVRVLSRYDHNQYYYIGSSSESHIQNIHFSYAMAYGGGGFAISYPLAKALSKMQDRCIKRYPSLYGSDDRIQACMSELGVPLTKEPGFHQFDVYGNLFGLLAAHPVTPLVSLHHLDLVSPIFPSADRIQALRRLSAPLQLDSAALMQQSICYDQTRNWTISVSWGYAVQIFRGIIPPREIERPARTFLNWYRHADHRGYPFNTRPVSTNKCQRPFVYCLSDALYDTRTNQTISEYVGYGIPNPRCNWLMANPSQIHRVEVYKTPDPYLWDKAPRRNCCRILPTEMTDTLVVDVGECREDEVIET